MRRDQLRKLVALLLTDYKVSERRACRIVLLHRTVWQYKTKGKKDDQVLRARMRDIAQTRVRYGMWRIFTLLRREGWKDNHKRVYRLMQAGRAEPAKPSAQTQPGCCPSSAAATCL